MGTKSISTQQANQVLDATHFLKVSSYPVKIFNIEGETTSTNGISYYIQVHGSAPTTTVTVPLYSTLCVTSQAASGVNGWSFTYGKVGIDTSRMNNPYGTTTTTDGANNLPVYLAISSTDNVYTSVAAATHCRIDAEDSVVTPVNMTVVGDTTTAVASLTVWADPSAAHKLMKFTVTNNSIIPGQTLYLMLFAYNNAATGAVSEYVWPVAQTATLTREFGVGIAPIQGTTADYVIHTGCYLVGSSQPNSLHATTGVWTMEAWYI